MKSEILKLPLTPEQRRRLQAEAKKHGESAAAFVRRRLFYETNLGAYHLVYESLMEARKREGALSAALLEAYRKIIEALAPPSC